MARPLLKITSDECIAFRTQYFAKHIFNGITSSSRISLKILLSIRHEWFYVWMWLLLCTFWITAGNNNGDSKQKTHEIYLTCTGLCVVTKMLSSYKHVPFIVWHQHSLTMNEMLYVTREKKLRIESKLYSCTTRNMEGQRREKVVYEVRNRHPGVSVFRTFRIYMAGTLKTFSSFRAQFMWQILQQSLFFSFQPWNSIKFIAKHST